MTLHFPNPETLPSNVSKAKNIALELHRGEFCSLVGPRKTGKSSILNILTNYITADYSYNNQIKVCHIDLNDYSLPLKNIAYHSIAKRILADCFIEEDIAWLTSADEIENGDDLIGFFRSILDLKTERILLILDHMEAIPEFVAKSILKTFRNCFNLKDDRETRNLAQLSVMVSGNLSIESLTKGASTSPFLLTKEIPDELPVKDIRNYLRKITWEDEQLFLDEAINNLVLFSNLGRDLFSHYLFSEFIANRFSSVINGPLSWQTAKSLLDLFIGSEFQQSIVYKSSVHHLNKSIASLKLINRLLQGDKIQFSGAPMSSEIELSGAVRRSDKYYGWRNGVYEIVLRKKLSPASLMEGTVNKGTLSQSLDGIKKIRISRNSEDIRPSIIKAADLVRKTYSIKESVDVTFEILKRFLGKKTMEIIFLSGVGNITRIFKSPTVNDNLEGSNVMNKGDRRNRAEIVREILDVGNVYLVGEKNSRISVYFPMRKSNGKNFSILYVKGLMLERDYINYKDLIEQIAEFSLVITDTLANLAEKETLVKQKNLLIASLIGLILIIGAVFPNFVNPPPSLNTQGANFSWTTLNFLLSLSNSISALFVTSDFLRDTQVRNVLVVLGLFLTVALAISANHILSILQSPLFGLGNIFVQLMLGYLLFRKYRKR